MSLKDKIIVVTGAGGNLGTATVAALSGAGAHIVAADQRDDALQQSMAMLDEPARHLGVPGVDLANDEACAMLVARALERYGRIDGLATTVGGFAAAPLAETSSDLLLRMVQINAVTTLNIMRAAVRPMRAARKGSLVVVGAASARRATSDIAAYAASKSAVFRLVESFADELRPEGIRVNAVLPGTLDTPQNRAAMPDADRSAWLSPSQIADVIAFLLSDAASGVTGALNSGNWARMIGDWHLFDQPSALAGRTTAEALLGRPTINRRSKMSRVSSLLSWPAALYIAGILLWYERYKLPGADGSVWLFTVLSDWVGIHGYEKPFRLTVAIAEIVASVLVVVPVTRVAGAALSLGIMSGAIFFHLVSPLGIDPYGDGGRLFKEACTVWLSSAFILILYRKDAVAMLQHVLKPSGWLIRPASAHEG